jgi:hypothetical protein
VASKTQKQFRLEVQAAGAEWRMARSARAAMMALHLSGVVFRRPWEPPRLEPWEGPFADATQRLLQAPEVAAQRRAALRAYRERAAARAQGATARDATQRDAEAGSEPLNAALCLPKRPE